ncbi:uncharacterized protein PV06_00941 [Exophiala oligosperma]|uniref:2,5-diamino-6-ribosylamino-4(3H)-pyrimidinone 5'-phosphate reductase n=2 Tax=Chaetothyriales TaxID=34395 RepID=A0A0D2CEL2_9EURO|nr:uncharacterized protein PV06_00941 [Exophiala oligosperma]KAJ9633243.1 hypothetical protein H2204_007139 [Knufia peltigerae]KIW48342.1 hypothetical protein PV06_00941 [Exophiala oligosperma]
MSSGPQTPMTPDGTGTDRPEDDQLETEDEGQNDTTMQDGEDGGEQRTLQNGKSYTMSDEPTDYSIFSNPPDLGQMRQRLHDLEEPIEIPAADFETYFPFVDNIWRKMRTGEQPETSIRTEYYACRLRKVANQKPHVPRPTPEGKQSRKKRIRDDKTCSMTMKVVYNSGPVDSCTISRVADVFQKHTHDLDYIDSTKRNSGIMDTARREAARGFLPASIYWKMWEEPEKMYAAGGKFMKVSDVRNVQYAWRQNNQQLVLKAHTGFNPTRVPRQHHATPPKPLPPPPAQPGVFGRLEPSNTDLPRPDAPLAPMDTLQYPQHARSFLERYIPDQNAIANRARPHVTLTWASSLDSKITQAVGTSTAISGPETKAMTHYLRSQHDAILVGVTTAIVDDPALNCRLASPNGYGGLPREQQPRPIIIDPHARLIIRPELKVLKTASEGRGKAPWVVVAPGAMLHPVAVSTLKAHGGEYLMINDYSPQAGGLNWEGLFNVLYREGIRSVMIEGGGIVLSELLKVRYSHLIDSVIMTIAPTFFGKGGVPVSPDPTFDYSGRPIATRLRNVRWQPMGESDVVLCGQMALDRPGNGILPGIEEFSRATPDGPNQHQKHPPIQAQPPPSQQNPPPNQQIQQPPQPGVPHTLAQQALPPQPQGPSPQPGPTPSTPSLASPAR